MPSKYYSPPTTLVPNTTARSAYFNNEFSISMQQAFESLSVGVAGDIIKTLMHETLTLTSMVATALQMAGKLVSLDATGLILQPSATAYGIFRGAWVTATNYNQGDWVRDNQFPFGLLYALKAFTSGATSSVDVVAGNLVRMTGFFNMDQLPMPLTVLANPAGGTALSANNAYLVSSVTGNITLTLPASANVGDCITLSINPTIGNSISVQPPGGGGGVINGVFTPQVIYSGSGSAHGARFYYTGVIFGWVCWRSY